MRTSTVEALGDVAVMTEDLKSRRVCRLSQPVAYPHLSLLVVLASPTVDMVDCKELHVNLAAAGARRHEASGVNLHHLESRPCPIIGDADAIFSVPLPVVGAAVPLFHGGSSHKIQLRSCNCDKEL